MLEDTTPTLNKVTLTLRSVGSMVEQLRSLVKQQSYMADTLSSLGNLPTSSNVFDKDLYDRSVELAKLNSVSLNYSTDSVNQKYGLFNGGNVYLDFNGLLNTSLHANPCYGWITLDNSSNTFCMFKNHDTSYIININDFTPQPIVEDFTPLYNKLSRLAHFDDNLYSDINSAYSLAVTYKEAISHAILNLRYEAWLIYMNIYRTLYEVSYLAGLWEDTEPAQELKLSFNDETDPRNENKPVSPGVYPQPIRNDSSRVITDSDNNIHECQAIVYALDDSNLGNPKHDMLVCFQQPSSVSYSASATFDNPTPRGAQQPFMLYTNANAISLSFELNFHVDELQTMYYMNNNTKQAPTLSDIADIAESFTRPWSNSVNSIKPKLSCVILPGLVEVGYITDVQISYSGDMMGDYSANRYGGGVDNRSTNGSTTLPSTRGGTSNYYYNQLSVSFTLLVTKDISLKPNNKKFEINYPDQDPKKDLNNTATTQSNSTDILSTIEQDKNVDEIVDKNTINADIIMNAIDDFMSQVDDVAGAMMSISGFAGSSLDLLPL